jgi:uncharacterized membrane protein YfcA
MPWTFAFIGLVGGLLGGLLGLGGGFVMVPLQVMLARTGMRQATGTSLAAVVPIAVVGALIYYFYSGRHEVNLEVALFLVLGAIGGAYLGARFVNRVPETQLKYALAILLALVGLKEVIAP